MHLHTLTVQALGPFPGRHTIDLASLGASGIFLLEGPTGAGKSTLIDAIVFALYGKVASKEASEERLRSGHADPSVETVVDLVLECSSGIYRVRRTPAYPRPKQRGTGTTTQQATVKLWRLTSPDAPDGGELLSNRLDEAGAELQRIVGLDRGQFVQTVVLPQGEFAAFLRANPEDRRGLLQKVFGTEVYERVQQRLERLRQEVGRALDDARDGVDRAVAQLCGAAALEEEDAEALRAAVGEDGTGLRTLVESHVRRLDEVAAGHEAQAATAETARAAAARSLDEARDVLSRTARRDRLRADRVRLQEAAVDVAAAAERLASGRRAQVVLAAVRGIEQARTALATARTAADDARAAAGPALWSVVDPDTEPAVQRKALAAEREEGAAERGGLRRAGELETALPARRLEIDAAQDALTGRRREHETTRQEREDLPRRRTALTTALQDARHAGAQRAAAEQRVAAAETVLRAARDLVRLEADVRAAEATVAQARATAEAALVEATRLHRARIAGIAGELAADLVPGEPCAVCGGTDHPRPAPLDPAHVTAERVEAAEFARTAAVEALTAASAALADARTLADGRRAEAAGQDVAAAEGTLAGARTDLAAAEQAGRDVVRLEAEVAELDRAQQTLDAHAAAVQEEVLRAEERLTHLRTVVAEEEREVAEARAGHPSVAARLRELDRRIEALRTWEEALGEVEEAEGRQEQRTAELEVALAEQGFSGTAEVEAARVDPAELTALERRVAEHTAAVAAVEHGLADPALTELPEVPDVDLDAVEQTCVAAQARATETAAEATRARHCATAATGAAAGVTAALDRWVTLAAESGPVVRMADLATASGSDNAQRVTLATYVLMRRFEDVVAAANARLTTMSSGRYELVRSDEREAVRARRTGLAMKVLDHRTGTARDPRTLSGGETFYVSLCLALGLADVVTAEAGGTTLGTLFVDEGFGSLDPETLDLVLAELGRLRDGGRMVGVVSHVEALKQSIAERIEVRRLPSGGSTLTVRA